jgi:hypothetical protein
MYALLALAALAAGARAQSPGASELPRAPPPPPPARRLAARVVPATATPSPPLPFLPSREPPKASRTPAPASDGAPPAVVESLRGRCFATTAGIFYYEYCPFFNITQREILGSAMSDTSRAFVGLLGV